MKRNNNKYDRLRDHNILMDVRNCIIAVQVREDKPVNPIKLSDYYRHISDGFHVHRIHDVDSKYNCINTQRFAGDRATDNLQDAVRQLVRARKNLKASGQIRSCRDTLRHALQDTLRYGGAELLGENGLELAVSAIDQAVIESIAKREIERAVYAGRAA